MATYIVDSWESDSNNITLTVRITDESGTHYHNILLPIPTKALNEAAILALIKPEVNKLVLSNTRFAEIKNLIGVVTEL